MGSLATSRGCMKGFLSDLGWSDGMFKSYLETMINWPTGDQHWHPLCSWKARVHLGVGPRIGIIPRIQVPSLCHSRLREASASVVIKFTQLILLVHSWENPHIGGLMITRVIPISPWFSVSISLHDYQIQLNTIIHPKSWTKSFHHHNSITIINLLVLNVGNEGMIHKDYQFHNPSNPHSHPFRTFSTSKSITIPSNNVIFHDFQYQSVFMNFMTIKFN